MPEVSSFKKWDQCPDDQITSLIIMPKVILFNIPTELSLIPFELIKYLNSIVLFLQNIEVYRIDRLIFND
ncbi:hypothetical protein CHA01nite_29040 [Chryseobacterium hagamense]|uniref:Uncharacterized protein n=1 Tax=Chryseobacterium hagamense TaxID=395935 RepID=A0A511YPP5_9FLAO|nr:hypothetical protein CHA01nite_29040 [Chryseobacterium hagamense]